MCFVVPALRSGLGAFVGELRGDFERVVGAAAVAAGVAGDELERIVVGGQFLRAEAAFAVFESLTEQDGDAIFAERFEHIDAAAGEQRGDDFKRRILSGCADEADGRRARRRAGRRPAGPC
jgi:hypothetical protein